MYKEAPTTKITEQTLKHNKGDDLSAGPLRSQQFALRAVGSFGEPDFNGFLMEFTFSTVMLIKPASRATDTIKSLTFICAGQENIEMQNPRVRHKKRTYHRPDHV